MQKMESELITFAQIQQEFCKTQAWKDLWPNLEKLLRQIEFDSLDKGEVHDAITKLEFGTLGLLWCSGDMNPKAEFFYYLINPDLENYVNKFDLEMQLIFNRLLYFSIDLPKKYHNLISGQEMSQPLPTEVDMKKYNHLLNEWIVKDTFTDSMESRTLFVAEVEEMDWIFDEAKIRRKMLGKGGSLSSSIKSQKSFSG